MPKLNDAFREQLTPEEITAFEAENEDDATEALETLAAGADDDDDESAATSDDDAAHDDADDAPEDAPEDAPAKAKQEDPQPEPKREPVEEPQIDPHAAKAALDDAKAKRKELRDAYNDGDLTDEEFDAEMEKLDDAVATAQADLKTAQRSAQRNAEAWKQAGRDYLDRYPGLKADGVIQALDKTVQDLSQYPTLANLPHDQFLERVHKKLLADAEFTGLAIPPISQPATKPAKRPAPEGDPSLGKPPKTLAQTPASDVSALDDSPYAPLERLSETDPIAFENAMAKLPKDKRDEFASLYIG